MQLFLLVAAAFLSLAAAELIPVHRPDLIRARCVNDTNPPYGYELKTESFYSTTSSKQLGATASTGKLYGSNYPTANSSTKLVLLDPTGTGPRHTPSGYPSSGYDNGSGSSRLIAVTGTSSKSYKSYYYPYQPSSTSIIVVPSGTDLKYPVTTAAGIEYRNTSSSTALVDATGLSSSRKPLIYANTTSGTSKILVDPIVTGPKYPIGSSSNRTYGVGSSSFAATSPVGSGQSSRPSSYPTGAHLYNPNSTSGIVIGPTGTGSAYSVSTNTSVKYSSVSASTSASASSTNIKSSSSALYLNGTTSRTGIDIDPTGASSSTIPYSSATPRLCPHDNVLRALLRHDDSASSFCPHYLRPRALYGPVIPLPVYLVGFPAFRVSTACSCFTAGVTTTVRATSTFITTLTRSSPVISTPTSLLIGPIETNATSSALPLATRTITGSNGTKSRTTTDSLVGETITSVIVLPITNLSTSLSIYGTGSSGSITSIASTVSTVTTTKTSGNRNSTGSIAGSPVTASSSSRGSPNGTALPSYGYTYGGGSSASANPIQSRSSSASAPATTSKTLHGYAPKPYGPPAYSLLSYGHHYE